jgi:hypothetical protein
MDSRSGNLCINTRTAILYTFYAYIEKNFMEEKGYNNTRFEEASARPGIFSCWRKLPEYVEN